jgi:lysophospholipase L1-like esterase
MEPKIGASRPRIFGILTKLFVLVLATEAMARFTWEPPTFPDLQQSDPKLAGVSLLERHPTRIWAMPSGTIQSEGMSVSIDHNGLRKVELTGAPNRILTLGESTIFGQGLEEANTLHAQLARHLSADNVSADVLCGGVLGYSTEQLKVLLDEVGWDLEPNLIVLAAVWSDNRFEHFIDRDWMATLQERQMLLHNWLSFSRAWQWTYHALHPPPQWDERSSLNVGWVRAPNTAETRRVSLNHYKENLNEIIGQARARNIGVVVMVPSNKERLTTPWGWPWDSYLKTLISTGEHHGVPVLDSQPDLAASGISPEEAFLDPMHPSAAGNAIISRSLADLLLDQGWPDNRLVPSS